MGAYERALMECAAATERRAMRARDSAVVRVEPEAFPEFPSYYRGIAAMLSRFASEFPLAAERVPMVYACITKIASDVARTPLRFYEGRGRAQREIEREPGNIVDVWARANPTQSDFTLEIERQASLETNGNGYLFLETFGQTTPTADWELWSMPGDLVHPVATEHRGLRAFEWHGGDRPIAIDADRVIHFAYWSPRFEPAGMSPLEAARLGYETRWLAARWNREFYARGAQVAGVYTMIADGAPAREMRELKKALMDHHAGLDHAFEPVILQNMKPERTGLTHADMGFTASLDWSDADICRVFGIPPVIMGIKQGGGLSDAGASTDLLLYHTNCLEPRLILRDRVLTERFCTRWSPDYWCQSDVAGVLALQEQRFKQYAALQKGTGRPFVTVNEARRAVGLPPMEEDSTADELYIPPRPASTDTREDPDGRPRGDAQDPADPDEPDERRRQARAEGELAEAERRAGERRRRASMVETFHRRFARRFRAIFDEQEEAVLRALRRQFDAMGQRGAQHRLNDLDLAAIERELDETGTINEERIRAILLELITERGEQVLDELGVALEVELNRLIVAQHVEEAARKVLVGTSRTTTNMLREKIAAAIRAGADSYGDFAGVVREVFDNRRANANTIARTETLGAFNFAGISAARQSGVVGEKGWFTAHDEVVRKAHVDAEEAGNVPLEGKFTLTDSAGNEVEMDYPGDPSAPADLVCNCRCVLQFFADEDKVRALRAEVARTGVRRRASTPVPAELVQWFES